MAFWSKKKPNSYENALTAAAMAIKASRTDLVIRPENENWQDEVWDFYDTLGEFRYAISWKSEMVSRVRLRAGRLTPGQDEPELLDEGPAADLIAELAGGIGGQAELMGTLTTQLDVPGEGWLVGEERQGTNEWRVYSNDEIRVKRGRENTYEVIDEESTLANKTKWRGLSNESLIIRVWRPHKRFHYLADSPARPARGTMRELELINRKIQAQYLSRLASAGVFVMPDEVSFPVREEFQDKDDPFTLEWIETAAAAIKNPGTASAVVPIPMRVPAEYADKFNFIDFTIEADEQEIEKRDSAIRRLATQIDVPAEILLGMGDVNHWTAWQLEEGAIKAHISADVELIVHALTKGYLIPRLKAMGVDIENLVVWYDASELTIRPDRSDNALKTYDRGELSGLALRRETGFDEGDAPTQDELRGIVLKKLAMNPTSGFIALAELISDPALLGRIQEAVGNGETSEEPSSDEEEESGAEQRDEPDTQEDEPEENLSTLRIKMANAQHRVKIGAGFGGHFTLYHPEECKDHLSKCPVTEASRFLKHLPGTSGAYTCWLSPIGELVVGKRVYDHGSFIEGHTRKGMLNGSGKRSRSKATR